MSLPLVMPETYSILYSMQREALIEEKNSEMREF